MPKDTGCRCLDEPWRQGERVASDSTSSPATPLARLPASATKHGIFTGCSFTRGDAHVQGKAILERFVLDICGFKR